MGGVYLGEKYKSGGVTTHTHQRGEKGSKKKCVIKRRGGVKKVEGTLPITVGTVRKRFKHGSDKHSD